MWFYCFPKVSAYWRKKLEIQVTFWSPEIWIFLNGVQISGKIMEIVKKKQHFFSGSNLKNLFHRKVVFRCIEQFLCDRFHFWASKKVLFFFTGFLAKNSSNRMKMSSGFLYDFIESQNFAFKYGFPLTLVLKHWKKWYYTGQKIFLNYLN